MKSLKTTDRGTNKSSNGCNKVPGQFGIYSWRILIIVPLFMFAVFLGFFLELVTVERLSLYTRFPLLISNRRDPCCRIAEPKPSQQHTKFTESREEDKEVHEEEKPPWKGSTLLNVSNFVWVRNNVSMCSNNEVDGLRILPVLVHSARSHFSERLAIRQSWGSVLRFKKWDVRLIFLLGEADRGLDPSRNQQNYEEEEVMLNSEQSHFGDVVVGSFVDSYRNLTLKHMMGYKWILNFCPEAAFVMKVDDDMFIDILRIIQWRNEDLSVSSHHSSRNSKVPDLYCNTFVGTKPQRCVGCKWYSSEAEWSQDYYPDYCSGWCYALTVDLIRKLYSVLDKVPFFWVDDVFATGVLMEQVKKEYDHGHYQPRVRHLWGQVRALDFKNFRPMCELQDMQMKRTFGTVVPVARGSNFDRDMICLWNKTRYDRDNHLHDGDHLPKRIKKNFS